LIQIHVAPSRLTEGIAWTTTGLAVGVAPGAAFAGRVIDNHGASAGFWVPLVAGLSATVVAWSFRPPKLATAT
ncbi:MAG: MFS transporter, partial [Actinomycetota bacterium]|nr:MFS transporter [Actinomycetota bacterium]